MASFEILEQATAGLALQASVRFTATDGRTDERQLAWPAGTPEATIAFVLGKMAERFEQETRKEG